MALLFGQLATRYISEIVFELAHVKISFPVHAKPAFIVTGNCFCVIPKLRFAGLKGFAVAAILSGRWRIGVEWRGVWRGGALAREDCH